MMADRQRDELDTLILERNSLAEKDIDPDVVEIVGELLELIDRMVPYEAKMEVTERDMREVQPRSCCDEFSMAVHLEAHDMMLEDETSVPSVKVSCALDPSTQKSLVHVQINEYNVVLPFQEFKPEANDLHKVKGVAAQEVVDQTAQQPDEQMDESTGQENLYVFDQSWQSKIQDDEAVEDLWLEGFKVLEEAVLLLGERDEEGNSADQLILDKNDRVIESPQPNYLTVQEMGAGSMIQGTGQPEDSDEFVEREPTSSLVGIVNELPEVCEIHNFNMAVHNSGLEEIEVSTTAAQPDEKSNTNNQTNQDDIEPDENKATEIIDHTLPGKDGRTLDELPEGWSVEELRFELMEGHQTSSQSDGESDTAVLLPFENRIEDLKPVVQTIQELGSETVGGFATRAQPDEGSDTGSQPLPKEDGTIQKSLLNQLVQDLGVEISDDFMCNGQPQSKCGAVGQVTSQDSEPEAQMGQEARVIVVEEFYIARKPNQDPITGVATHQDLEFHPDQEIQECEIGAMETVGQPTDKDDSTEEPKAMIHSIQDSGVEAVEKPAVGQLACESDPAVQSLQESEVEAMEESFTGQPDGDPKTATQMKTRKSLQVEEDTIQESEPYCSVRIVDDTTLKNSGLNLRECYSGDILQVPAEAEGENNSNKTDHEKLVKIDNNAFTGSATSQRSDDEKLDVIGSQIPGFSRINFYAVQPVELVQSTAKRTSKWTVNFSYYVKEEGMPMKEVEELDEKMYCEDFSMDTNVPHMMTKSEISDDKDTQCLPLTEIQSVVDSDGNDEQFAASPSTSQCCENEEQADTVTQREEDFGAPYKHFDSVATNFIDVAHRDDSADSLFKDEATDKHHYEETNEYLRASDGSQQASSKSCLTNSSRTDSPDEDIVTCENGTFAFNNKSSALTAGSGEDVPDAAKCVSFASPLTELHEYQVLSQDSFASQSTLDISELLNADQGEECDLNAELQLIFEGKMDKAGSQQANISCQLSREPECSLGEKGSNENIPSRSESDVGLQSASSRVPKPEGFRFMHQLPNNPGRANLNRFYRSLDTRTPNDIFLISDNSMQYVDAVEENSLYACEPLTKEKKIVDQVPVNCDALSKGPQSSEDLYKDIENGQDQEECRGSQEVPDELEVVREPINCENCEDQAVPSMENEIEEPSARSCLNAPSCGYGNFGSGACLWHYPATSTTGDHVIDGSVNELPTIQPLQSCRKPVRIGLSKRQRVAHLHPYLRPKTS